MSLKAGTPVILSNRVYGTEERGTLVHDYDRGRTVHTIRRDDGSLYRTEGTIRRQGEESSSEHR